MNAPFVLAATLQLGADLDSRHDNSDESAADIGFVAEAAVELERAGFALVVIDDTPAVNAVFEPYTLGAALAYATDRLGIAVASPTTGVHPYHAARRLASIDHLSGGRAAWLVGHDPDPAHAAEYVDVVRALWDSWDDDAFIRDVDAGRYYDPAGLHTPEYDGAHYRVRGPLNISRPPQGYPVVIHDLSASATTPHPSAPDHSRPDFDADVIVVATTDQRIERLDRHPTVLVRTATVDADALQGWQRDGNVDGALIEGIWTTDHVRDLIGLATALDLGPPSRSTGCHLRDRLGLARPPRRDHIVNRPDHLVDERAS